MFPFHWSLDGFEQSIAIAPSRTLFYRSLTCVERIVSLLDLRPEGIG